MLSDAMRYKRTGRKWTGIDWTDEVVQKALRQLATAIKSGRSLFGTDVKSEACWYKSFRTELEDAFKQIDRDNDSSVTQ